MRPVIYTTGRLPDEVERGRVYKRKHRPTSVVLDDVILKDASGFESVDRARTELRTWRERGHTGAPSSPARIFAVELGRAVEKGEFMHPGRANPGPSPIDSQGTCWLWIESAVAPGTHVTGAVHHYDINQAFWSATRRGVPSAFFPYQEGDREWVGRVKIRSAARELPAHWRHQDEATVTADDVRFWGMDVEVLDAVSYGEYDVDLTPLMRRIGQHYTDWTAKRARQQSWGVFAQSPGSIFQEVYRDGEMTSQTALPERWVCPEWAAIITRRIMRHVASRKREGEAVSLYVDSVLARRPISGRGTTPGTWRKEGTYEQGIYMEGPGLWDSRPRSTRYPSTEWKKHAGISDLGRGARETAVVTDEETEEEIKEWEWQKEYEEYMQQFVGVEKMADKVKSPPEKTPTSSGLSQKERQQLKSDAPF